ncbi:hypothetical protein BT63DRAFT_98614 [Microthyrium microscopicum]|uniref:Uncharacterized protein n=1 Tax=Microthyrium microscopicum TaxID=703497 RepID=A0A6A6TZR0_9PEZI|nr:hypothetical protein BT63DRAFT_98614 [Microthyrium microscopicum]
MVASEPLSHVTSDLQVANKQTEQAGSYLLKLPLEIRLEIYEYLHIPTKRNFWYYLAIEYGKVAPKIELRTALKDPRKNRHVHLEILATCRQILYEVLPEVNSSILFRLYLKSITPLDSLPFKAKNLVTRLRIESRESLPFFWISPNLVLPALQELIIAIPISFQAAWYKWQRGMTVSNADLIKGFERDPVCRLPRNGIKAIFNLSGRVFTVKRVILEFDLENHALGSYALGPDHRRSFARSFDTWFDHDREGVKFIRRMTRQLGAFPDRKVVWRYRPKEVDYYSCRLLEMIADDGETRDEKLCEVWDEEMKGVNVTSRFEELN